MARPTLKSKLHFEVVFIFVRMHLAGSNEAIFVFTKCAERRYTDPVQAHRCLGTEERMRRLAERSAHRLASAGSSELANEERGMAAITKRAIGKRFPETR